MLDWTVENAHLLQINLFVKFILHLGQKTSILRFVPNQAGIKTWTFVWHLYNLMRLPYVFVT